jgi:hypothetical protein
MIFKYYLKPTHTHANTDVNNKYYIEIIITGNDSYFKNKEDCAVFNLF